MAITGLLVTAQFTTYTYITPLLEHTSGLSASLISPTPAHVRGHRSGWQSLMPYREENVKQTGFAMAIGIVLASMLVSTLLVPALTALVGRRAWWPRRPSRRSEPLAHPSLAK